MQQNAMSVETKSSSQPNEIRTNIITSQNHAETSNESLDAILPALSTVARNPPVLLHNSTAICVVPVGLPARGKTYMSLKLGRYLRWLGIKTSVFSVGTYRRTMFGTSPAVAENKGPLHDFAILESGALREQRDAAAQAAQKDLAEFFKNRIGCVAIYDDTMTILRSFRQQIATLLAPFNVQLVYIEVVCNMPHVIEACVREVKLSRPELVDWARSEDAVDTYVRHIERYRPLYEPINESDVPNAAYITVTNLGQDFAEQMTVHNVRGHIQTRFVLFLLNLHITARTIYLLANAPMDMSSSVSSKCPEEKVRSYMDYNISFRDDHCLSGAGVEYARKATEKLLAMRAAQGKSRFPKVYVSTRKCSIETAQFFPASLVTQKASLVRLNPGAADGLTKEELQAKYPEEYERHLTDPFFHRYPRAESYQNLAQRIESTLLELEGEKTDVLVIAHVSVLRCLYGYLTDCPEKNIPTLEFGANVLLEMAPGAYGKKVVHKHSF